MKISDDDMKRFELLMQYLDKLATLNAVGNFVKAETNGVFREINKILNVTPIPPASIK